MDYRHICTAAMLANGGLQTAHDTANSLYKGEEKPDKNRMVELFGIRLMLFRHIILEIANIADLADLSRPMFKEHPDLGKLHSELSKAFEFLKYIRNKYVGHFDPELTEKTFEWQPAANSILGKKDASSSLIMSMFSLETAINTYTDPATGHKIFDSETDLNYPQDNARFLNFLGETAIQSLEYSERLIEIAAGKVDTPDMKSEWLKLAKKAGKTEFRHLTKKKR